jgi:uncharacterized protein
MHTSKINLVVKNVVGWGSGVISKVAVDAATRIFEFGGDLLSDEQLILRAANDVPDFLQIGIGRYISKSGTFDDLINHSCNPNCYVKIIGNRAWLMSLYKVMPGMELTFDYSTTSTDTLGEWKIDCKCGYVHCRKVISGFQYLPSSVKTVYKSKGVLPDYILPLCD